MSYTEENGGKEMKVHSRVYFTCWMNGCGVDFPSLQHFWHLLCLDPPWLYFFLYLLYLTSLDYGPEC